MKKIIPLFICIILSASLLAGCNKSKPREVDPEDNPTNAFESAFSCDLDITSGDFVTSLHMEKNAEGTMKFTVQKPDSLSGLSCQMTVSEVTFSYGPLTISPGQIPIKAQSVAAMLQSLFKLQNYPVSEADGVVTVQGSDDGGAWTMTFEKENFVPIEITYTAQGDRPATKIAVHNFEKSGV